VAPGEGAMTRLEDVLDIRKHARLRWYLSPEEATLERVASEISYLAPEFALWDDQHRREWATVAHLLTGGGIDVLKLEGTYEERLLWPEERAEEEFRKAPFEGEIWAPSLSGEGDVCVESLKEYPVEPAELARRCEKIGPGAYFKLRGYGRYVRGTSRGWRSLCRHGQWLCPWCGEAVENWAFRGYSRELWPYVGVVPGSRWHRAPGARRRRPPP